VRTPKGNVGTRGRLLSTLYESRHSDPDNPADVEGLCRKLGILPELLEEARLLKLSKMNNFIAGTNSGTKATVISTPGEIVKRVEEAATDLRTTKAGIVRSLVYRYLTNEEEPIYSDFWILDGTRYVVVGRKKSLKASMPKGTWDALVHRCERRRLSHAGLIKTLVVNFLAEDYAQDLVIITKGHFYPNKEDYFLGD